MQRMKVVTIQYLLSAHIKMISDRHASAFNQYLSTWFINLEEELRKAVRDRSLSLVKIYVNAGADVNFINSSKASALTTAAQYGELRIVKYMIKHDSTHWFGAFKIACLWSRINIIDFFLNKYRDEDTAMKKMIWFSLCEACSSVLEHMIEQGVDIKAVLDEDVEYIAIFSCLNSWDTEKLSVIMYVYGLHALPSRRSLLMLSAYIPRRSGIELYDRIRNKMRKEHKIQVKTAVLVLDNLVIDNQRLPNDIVEMIVKKL